MKNRYPHTLLFYPVLLLIVATVIVYPYYQYYVDPDAVAYLTISKRYASGDTATAVNGYWSPWSCWLTAWLIRQGTETFTAAIVVNTIGATGFLITAYFLFVRFIKDRVTVTALSLTLALFLVYAIFKQSFADLWYIFFLMAVLLVMLKKKFLHSPWMWVLTGMLGALSYYSKAYAFPYFIFSTAVITALLVKNEQAAFNYRKWITVSVVAILTMILFSVPWIGLLYEKYGRWMTSTAGSLNLSWYLIGHPYYKDGIDLLIPPVYADAIYYWEDPYLVNGQTPHFWNSPMLFLMQLVRGGYTLLKLVNSMNELSAFFLLTGLCGALIVFTKLKRYFHTEVYILGAVFLLFPVGYLLINFESRYLWYLLPIGMIMGALLIDKAKLLFPGYVHRVLLAVFCISFLIFPVWDMKALYRVGEKEHHLAEKIKAAKVHGSFASNIWQLEEMQAIIRVAYFSGNSFYYMPWPPASQPHLLEELQRYHVNYYFHFHEPYDAPNVQFRKEDGSAFPVVFEDTAVMGLTVYQLNP